MVKLDGTVAAFVLLLASVTVRPAGGAGPLSATVADEGLPPVTETGATVNDAMAAGFTVSEALAVLLPMDAVTGTLLAVATPTVVAVKACEVFPAATVTLAGTLTDGSALLSDTATPPDGAAWLMVTVPVELVPPVTAVGLKVTAVSEIAGRTVTPAVTEVAPVAAVAVTEVEPATEPAVTMKV